MSQSSLNSSVFDSCSLQYEFLEIEPEVEQDEPEKSVVRQVMPAVSTPTSLPTILTMMFLRENTFMHLHYFRLLCWHYR
jgi:hypothetical protein